MNPTLTRVLAILGVMAALVAAAEIPGIEQSPVFVSGKDGYHTYRIPALIVSPKGTVLAFCEGRKDGGGDAGRIDLLLKRSTDGGRTWSAQQVVWSDGRNTCGNPAPVIDQATGTIWLLMTWNLAEDRESAIEHGTSKDTRRVFATHSKDDGVTWTKPVEITQSVKRHDWGWYATGPVHGIQLTRGPHKGRLVIPANHSERDAQGKPVSRSHCIYSDDHGKTWALGGVLDERTNESTIVELSDGTLLQNMRTYKGKNRRAVARSYDGGVTWTAVRHDEILIEPVCQASLLRGTWPGIGRKSRVLFSNPASLQREKMTVRVSYDEGRTWPVSVLLYEGPSAYSCLTVLPGGLIGCLYERGEKRPYETITLARFGVAAIEK
jgi:sialidase-1